MFSIEVSSLGSACGKNKFEPRDKTLLIQLCKKNKELYRNLFFESGIFVTQDKYSDERELKKIYDNFKKEIISPDDFKNVKNKIKKEMKDNGIVNKEFEERIIHDFKKDCGKNNESKVISNKNYISGNNKLWYFTGPEGWQLRGMHDAVDGEIVIEIKTRMKIENVRKNTYDIYQLFGYLLIMGKTKGKIIQYFQDTIYDSDIETDIEYGLIDITTTHKKEFNKFYSEVCEFFEEVKKYENIIFDYSKIIKKYPIARFDVDGIPCNIVAGFEKIVKILS